MTLNENWITQLRYYADNFGISNYTFYFPVGTILVFIILFFLHHYFFKIKERTVTDNLIRSAFFGSLFTTMLLLSVVFILKRFTGFFAEEKTELIVLIILLSLCLFTILIVVKGKKLFNKNKENLIIGFPLSSRHRHEVLFSLKKKFNLRKIYWILAITPFIILFLKPSSKYLYSIVVDNSASMENNLAWGVNSFSGALSYSPKEAQYVLSYLPLCNDEADCLNKAKKLKTTLGEISKVNKPDSLGSLTFVFDRSENVINAINQDIQISGISSPLSEMIWQNYLTTREIPEGFSEKRLIILTDGADNLYFPNEKGIPSIGKSILDSKSKDGSSPRDFYDKIFFINQGGDESIFLFGDSDVEILNGSNSSEYYKSVQTVMSLISFDLIFVYLCLSLLILTLIALLFINPRVTN